MESHFFDAYKPEAIARRVEAASVVKGTRALFTTFCLAILAGAFIAFGAALYTLVIHDSELSVGLTRLLGGLVFSLGLILVVVAGAELFTGNNLLVMAWASKKISGKQLLSNWFVVYLGNFVGALSIVLFVWLSGHWELHQGGVGRKALQIAITKVDKDWLSLFFSGLLCNVLVCLAVWLCFAGRTVSDKILAIVFPITAFVALGFEHSVANMYFIPAGMLAGSEWIWPGFLSNMIPVTLGNIFGGGVLVALVYWFVYLRPQNDHENKV